MKNYCFTFFPVLIVAAALLFSGCRKEISAEKEGLSAQKSVQFSTKIPPGKCRITGTILKIYPPSATAQNNSPCSKFPCIASIKVDSVWGFGSAFAKPVKKGNEITLKFEFTLAPTTEEMFKNLDTRLPGLQENSVFSGDIEYLDPTENPDAVNDMTYRIFLYKK